MKSTLFELLESLAAGALETQREDGAFPPGHNGPYRDPETPVRNTAHWSITLTRLYELSGERHWLEAARAALRFLSSSAARPGGYTFHHRMGGDKDRCNGLIGQAWVLEALGCADRVWGNGRYNSLAEEVFFLHDFEEDLGLWHIRDVDGTRPRVDNTFNHQLWFAAAATCFATQRAQEVRRRICRFLDACAENLLVLDSGLIFHPVRGGRVGPPGMRAKAGLKRLLRRTGLERLVPGLAEDIARTRSKSVGYHAFNMYAFALLRRGFGDHPFFHSTGFQRAVDFLGEDRYVWQLDGNPYGYPYNPPGFEVPLSLAEFAGMARAPLADVTGVWAERQIVRTFRAETMRFERNTEDPETLTARVYEATRLPEFLLEVRIQTEECAYGGVSLGRGRDRGCATGVDEP